MDYPKTRCNDVKCNSWPTGIGDDMWEISGECNKYEVCKDGVVQDWSNRYVLRGVTSMLVTDVGDQMSW